MEIERRAGVSNLEINGRMLLSRLDQPRLNRGITEKFSAAAKPLQIRWGEFQEFIFPFLWQ
jgi:hypothetical protein